MTETDIATEPDEAKPVMLLTPTTPAGKLVSAYLAEVHFDCGRGDRKSILIRHAARCEHGVRGTGGRIEAIRHIVGTVGSSTVHRIASVHNSGATPYGLEDDHLLDAVLVALGAWGVETRRSRRNSDSPFRTFGMALGKLVTGKGIGSAAGRSINVLARANAATIRQEVARAAQVIAQGGGMYSHPLLADDVHDILSRNHLDRVRTRFAYEASSDLAPQRKYRPAKSSLTDDRRGGNDSAD